MTLLHSTRGTRAAEIVVLPEMPGEKPWVYGVWVSSINVCTSTDEALVSWTP